jgi:tRNA pseudouridine38-40 synthase
LTDHAFGILLTVAYDGTPFSGFQRQAQARTVQGELDGAVRCMDPRASLVRGLSRTDAGVHARSQYVSFDTDKELTTKKWTLGITQHLPQEIAVVRSARVPVGFDPRPHAVSKRYRYLVLESPVRDPFLEKRAWRIDERLNHQAMKDAANALIGRHDFRAFRTASDPRVDTVRHVRRVELTHPRADLRCLAIDVEGDRFLHKMVRIIVGTLVDIGRGRLVPDVVAAALKSGERRTLGMTAPPEGLYLEHIELDDVGQDAWPDQFSRD